jgi:hypothetical protein
MHGSRRRGLETERKRHRASPRPYTAPSNMPDAEKRVQIDGRLIGAPEWKAVRFSEELG